MNYLREISSGQSKLGRVTSVAMLLIALLFIVIRIVDTDSYSEQPLVAYLLLFIGWGLAGATLLGLPVQYLLVNLEHSSKTIWPRLLCIVLGICIYIWGLKEIINFSQ